MTDARGSSLRSARAFALESREDLTYIGYENVIVHYLR